MLPGGISVPELLIILAIVMLLFGASKLPETGKALGAGIRNFKKALSGDIEEEEVKEVKAKEVKEDTEKKTAEKEKEKVET